MASQDERTIRVIGQNNFDKIQDKCVMLFGLGGVGGYIAEALVRSGIKHLILVDHDLISESNLNRQILALHSNLGQKKIDVAKQRLLDIRPDCMIETYDCFYLPEKENCLPFERCDYIIDAIDTITAKIDLVMQAKKSGKMIISCMGTGNKLDPSQFKISDIYKTEMCPVCKVMRRELKKRQISSLKVLFSTEKPVSNQSRTPGSVSFVPSVAGLLIAAEVISDFMK